MKKKNRRNLFASLSLLVAFVFWTTALCFVDVRGIGPGGSRVGFAAVNAFIHRLTGVHMLLYHITDWLALVPVLVAFGFAMLGLAQWVKRKGLRMVDYSLLVLGGHYLAVMAVYLLFEKVPINFRPVLISGVLETSYPSSTTLFVLCIMPTAMMQFRSRIQNAALRNCISLSIITFCVFMVAGRLISGVHWFTDILGGGLLSGGLVMLYRYVTGLKE